MTRVRKLGQQARQPTAALQTYIQALWLQGADERSRASTSGAYGSWPLLRRHSPDNTRQPCLRAQLMVSLSKRVLPIPGSPLKSESGLPTAISRCSHANSCARPTSVGAAPAHDWVIWVYSSG